MRIAGNVQCAENPYFDLYLEVDIALFLHANVAIFTRICRSNDVVQLILVGLIYELFSFKLFLMLIVL